MNVYARDDSNSLYPLIGLGDILVHVVFFLQWFVHIPYWKGINCINWLFLAVDSL